MKFLADQCVWGKTIRLLQDNSFPVTTLKEIGQQIASDEEVLKIAKEEDAILITNDLDFSNIVTYPPSKYEGIIVLRLTARTQAAVHKVLLDLLKKIKLEAICHSLVVIDHHIWRIHS